MLNEKQFSINRFYEARTPKIHSWENVRRQIVIGITGRMGTGKTTFCNEFEKISIPVFNADNETKKLYKNKIIRSLIKEKFSINRLTKENLKKIVFGERRKQFQNFIFPYVIMSFSKWRNKVKSNIVVIESAILYELDLKFIDMIVYLRVDDESKLIERLIDRGMKRDDIERRLKIQLSDEEIINIIKKHKCHLIGSNLPINRYSKFVNEILLLINGTLLI